MRSGRPVVADVVIAGEPAPPAADLIEHLRRRLPAHMVPDRVSLVRQLPGPIGYEPAGDEIERELVRMWESLLGLDGIGVREDFIELGGDSLFAERLTARMCGRYGLDLSIADVFDHPTIKELAVFLRREISGGAAG